MSRLKSRPAMPNLFDLINKTPYRELKDGQSEEVCPKENNSGGQIETPVADPAFCRQCGEWLTSEHISLGITFRCPKCDFSLFSINRIGARKKWEKNRE